MRFILHMPNLSYINLSSIYQQIGNLKIKSVCPYGYILCTSSYLHKDFPLI